MAYPVLPRLADPSEPLASDMRSHGALVLKAAKKVGRARSAKSALRTDYGRTKDQQAVRDSILWAASEEFSQRGYYGARVADIATKSHFSKRMIYYYYKGKRTLYQAVLLEAYRFIRRAEIGLQLEGCTPRAALELLTRNTFDYHANNEAFVRLVVDENMHGGRNIGDIQQIRSVNASVIDQLADICARGRLDGSLRSDLDPLQLHLSISSLCFYAVANRHTVAAIFDFDVTSEVARQLRRNEAVRMVLAYATPP